MTSRCWGLARGSCELQVFARYGHPRGDSCSAGTGYFHCSFCASYLLLAQIPAFLLRLSFAFSRVIMLCSTPRMTGQLPDAWVQLPPYHRKPSLPYTTVLAAYTALPDRNVFIQLCRATWDCSTPGTASVMSMA